MHKKLLTSGFFSLKKQQIRLLLVVWFLPLSAFIPTPAQNYRHPLSDSSFHYRRENEILVQYRSRLSIHLASLKFSVLLFFWIYADWSESDKYAIPILHPSDRTLILMYWYWFSIWGRLITVTCTWHPSVCVFWWLIV